MRFLFTFVIVFISCTVTAQDDQSSLEQQMEIALSKYEETKNNKDSKEADNHLALAVKIGAQIYSGHSQENINLILKVEEYFLQNSKTTSAYSVTRKQFLILEKYYGKKSPKLILFLRKLTDKPYLHYSYTGTKAYSRLTDLVEKKYGKTSKDAFNEHIRIARLSASDDYLRKLYKRHLKAATKIAKSYNPMPETMAFDVDIAKYGNLPGAHTSPKALKKNVEYLLNILNKYDLEMIDETRRADFYSELSQLYSQSYNWEEAIAYQTLAKENGRDIEVLQNRPSKINFAPPIKLPRSWYSSKMKDGYVIFKFNVLIDGKVSNVKIVESKGPESVIKVAKENFSDYIYLPKLVDGKPVEAIGKTFKISFNKDY